MTARRRSGQAARVLFAGLAGAQLAYPRVPESRQPAATRAIVTLMLATSITELVDRRGGRRAAALSSVAAATGLAAEAVGVATGRPFGRYAYSERLGAKVAGVPWLAGAAWTMMAPPAWAVAGLLTRRRASRVLAAAGALTAWDVALDPRMVRDGYWRWADGGRYENVPASNFAGWLLVGAGIFAGWSVIDSDDDPRAATVPLALYVWTWIGEVVANLAFWGRPRVAVASGAAMGAFAIPALRARLRR